MWLFMPAILESWKTGRNWKNPEGSCQVFSPASAIPRGWSSSIDGAEGAGLAACVRAIWCHIGSYIHTIRICLVFGKVDENLEV